ncbi:MAG: hypothetical protein B6U87_03045 [Candidatus Aenigmarchaeota archaeon ex4484_52]|nr:MAG: hypothetical protein B6U87_03045 [Candidatus Aenigmarchaeota archaeon ex4484_52]
MCKSKINANFSGGEKKFSEITQVIATNPKFIIFDEVDSGVDLKNLEKIINIIKNWHSKNNSALVITHNPKVVELLKPDLIYVLLNGKIICSSNDWNKIYHTIKKYGYEKCEKCQMRKLYSN